MPKPKSLIPHDKKVILSASDGPDHIEVYSSDAEGVVDFSPILPAVYLSASVQDCYVKMGPFQLLNREMLQSPSAAMVMLREWHQKFSVPIANMPQVPPKKRRELREELIREELKEAGEKEDVIEAADALADLLYVVLRRSARMGNFLVDKVLKEVHRSNMTKVWEDGTVHYREDGKVIKPPTYSPANVKGVLEGC